jgi:hypothetical protein
MSDDVCIGPAGGCSLCYRPLHGGQTCEEAAAAAQARLDKRRKAHPTEIETAQCPDCRAWAVVAIKRRGLLCLKCRWTGPTEAP